MRKIAEFIVRMVARFAMHAGVSGEQLKIWADEECINEVEHFEKWRAR